MEKDSAVFRPGEKFGNGPAIAEAEAASKYDESTPFVCVPTAVAECVAEGECRPAQHRVRIFRTSSRSI
jgi:hypothetical protein